MCFMEVWLTDVNDIDVYVTFVHSQNRSEYDAHVSQLASRFSIDKYISSAK